MVDCNSCIFVRCCKDVGKKRKDCEYRKTNTDWIKNYLQSERLWKDEYNVENPTDEFLSYVLDLRHKENIDFAKYELKRIFFITFCIVFVTMTIASFFLCETYKWAEIYSWMLIYALLAMLAFWFLKAAWSFLKYIFYLLKVVVRGR